VYELAFKNKLTAAQVFLVTLEWEGDYTGNFCTTSHEAMEAMLALAKKWEWANTPTLLNFKRHKKGWSPMYSFHLTKRGLKEVYELAGPLLDKKKDAKVRHIVYGTRKSTAAGKPWAMKHRILSLMQAEGKNEWSTIELAMRLGLHPRTVQRHLNGDYKKRFKMIGLVKLWLVRKIGSGRSIRYRLANLNQLKCL
jgi:DNA-binding transcriptional ArsR family regulator